MQSETTYSLKQKLAKSRFVWLINVKFRFLSTLYAILDVILFIPLPLKLPLELKVSKHTILERGRTSHPYQKRR